MGLHHLDRVDQRRFDGTISVQQHPGLAVEAADPDLEGRAGRSGHDSTNLETCDLGADDAVLDDNLRAASLDHGNQRHDVVGYGVRILDRCCNGRANVRSDELMDDQFWSEHCGTPSMDAGVVFDDQMHPLHRIAIEPHERAAEYREVVHRRHDHCGCRVGPTDTNAYAERRRIDSRFLDIEVEVVSCDCERTGTLEPRPTGGIEAHASLSPRRPRPRWEWPRPSCAGRSASRSARPDQPCRRSSSAR